MPPPSESDLSRLQPGLTGTAALVVGEAQTAAHIGSGRAPVLATPIMIALMEAAAVDCVERLLPAGHESLGVRISVEHSAPTPVGLAVTAKAEIEEIDGRTLTFKVEARDPYGIIGSGRHVRVIVASDRFRAKAAAKGSLRN